MPSPRIIPVFCILLLAGGTAAAGGYFWEARQEYLKLAQSEAQVRRRVAEAEARLKQEQAEVERLRTDRAYVELKIRERLGYAKPGELVFKFEK